MLVFQNREIWSNLTNMFWVFRFSKGVPSIWALTKGLLTPLPTRHFGAHLGLILSFPDKIKLIFPPYLGKAQFDGTLFTKGPSLISGSLNLQLTMRHSSSAGGGLTLTELSICFDLNVACCLSKWQGGQGDCSSQLGPSPTGKETLEFNRCKRGLPWRSHSAGVCSYHSVHSHLK